MYKKLQRLAISLVFVTNLNSVFSQTSISSHFKILNTSSRSPITIDNIISDMAKYDVLFFGEEHNDSAAHYLENAIFQALFHQYPQLALSLEMFEADNQTVLNEYLKGFIDDNRLAKDARLWTNYKDYKPMIDFAKKNQVDVIAANPPRRYVNLVSRRGMKSLDSLSKQAKSFLPPLPYDTLNGAYRDKFMDIMKGSPGAGSANIYYSQSLWDAGMAWSIHKYLKENRHHKIFHCVGKFHVEEKLGTALQLQLLNKKLRIRNVIALADSSFNKSVLSEAEWVNFKKLGDYIILTDPALKKTY